jgi:hypothetical protein
MKPKTKRNKLTDRPDSMKPATLPKRVIEMAAALEPRAAERRSSAAPSSAFVVTAYRWGLRDAHSYVVGAYTTWQMAMSAANDHLGYRGGKYGIEVTECSGPPGAGGENTKGQVAYIESPYFGMAGQNRPACQPADQDKPPLESDALNEKLSD